jgi:hypothetical protein|tara:strand:- start:25 stop:606 length:582 start_codon:yes stop_codon:yes gene_type:complete
MLDLYEILIPVGEAGLTGNLADFMDGVIDFNDEGFIIEGDILIPTNGEPSMLPLEDEEVIALMEDYIIPEGMTLVEAIESGVFDGVIPEDMLDMLWDEEAPEEVVEQVVVAPKTMDLKEYAKIALMGFGLYFIFTKLQGMEWDSGSASVEPVIPMSSAPQVAPPFVAPVSVAPAPTMACGGVAPVAPQGFQPL